MYILHTCDQSVFSGVRGGTMVATFHSSLSHCCFDSCSNSIASAALGQSPIRSGCSFRINDLKACCTKEISWASIVKPKIALARMTWTFWAQMEVDLAGKMWVRKKTRSLLNGHPKLQGGRVGDCLTLARAFRPLSKISCVSVAESERSPGTPLLGAVGERHPEVSYCLGATGLADLA